MMEALLMLDIDLVKEFDNADAHGTINDKTHGALVIVFTYVRDRFGEE
jgi:hypothetical protein